MKNWMLELEKKIGSEDANLVIQVVAAILIVSTIVIANWYIVF